MPMKISTIIMLILTSGLLFNVTRAMEISQSAVNHRSDPEFGARNNCLEGDIEKIKKYLDPHFLEYSSQKERNIRSCIMRNQTVCEKGDAILFYLINATQYPLRFQINIHGTFKQHHSLYTPQDGNCFVGPVSIIKPGKFMHPVYLKDHPTIKETMKMLGIWDFTSTQYKIIPQFKCEVENNLIFSDNRFYGLPSFGKLYVLIPKDDLTPPTSLKYQNKIDWVVYENASFSIKPIQLFMLNESTKLLPYELKSLIMFIFFQLEDIEGIILEL